MSNNQLAKQRGSFLIKGGAVITVDSKIGTLPRANVLVKEGQIAEIGEDLIDATAEVIDAA
jgi:5-methylthioadenosine/S-adenosylhomocysteine deaminase